MEFAVLVLHFNILFSNKTQYVQKTGVEPVTFSSQILTLYQWAILATYEDLLYESFKHHAGFEPAPVVWKTTILATIRMVQMMVLTYAPEGKEDYQQPLPF